MPPKKSDTPFQAFFTPFQALVNASLNQVPTAEKAPHIPFHTPPKNSPVAFHAVHTPFQALVNASLNQVPTELKTLQIPSHIP